jgi:DNA-binding NarL/FixJ family response regulator
MTRSSAVLVVGIDALLTTALAVGLQLQGWPIVDVVRESEVSGKHLEARAWAGIVLVSDEAGVPPQYSFSRHYFALARVVMVGNAASSRAMARAVGLGADAAFNADQPLGVLVRAVDECLIAPQRSTSTDRSRLAAALHARCREAALFATLTSRECEILGAIVLGLTVAQIAVAEHLSTATVRTHVQHILVKLGVSSQVAAVALVHRSCRDPRLLGWTAKFVKFDDATGEASR